MIRYLLAVALSVVVHACSLEALAQPPDLTFPTRTLCTPAQDLACFTLPQVQQLLRIQAAAIHGLEVQALYDELEARHRAFEAAQLEVQHRLENLLALSRESNGLLSRELSETQTDLARSQTRLQRRRWVPWVTLSLGLALGAVSTWSISEAVR